MWIFSGVGRFAVALGLWPVLFSGGLAASAQQPNVVIIMADDLGWADTGPYGSEIPTPAITSLAANGLQFTNFRATPLCPSSRASLQTGQWAHLVGCGHLGDRGAQYPGYRGVMSTLFATTAGLLRAAGYETFHSGKRQVIGTAAQYSQGLYGFAKTFSCAIEGGDFYFWPPFHRGRTVQKNGVVQTAFPPGWFSSDAIRDEAIGFLQSRDTNKPFYLQLTPQDPHHPLQARPAEIAAQAGRYAAGWEAARLARWNRQKQLGLWPGIATLPPPDPMTVPYAQMTPAQRADNALRLEVYAAQVARLDVLVAAVVSELTTQNVLANTMIVFVSDNGALVSTPLGDTFHSGAGVGTPTFNGTVGGNGGCLSNTPFRRGKRWTHEGGLRVPCIIRYDAGIPAAQRGTLRAYEGHLIDFAPTVLALAGVVAPPLPGQSLVPTFTSSTVVAFRPLCYELEGRKCAMWAGWKLVQDGSGPLELYFIPNDPGEQLNLVGTGPVADWITRGLFKLWISWARSNNVSLVWPLR